MNKKMKVGAVSYLNTKPLIYGFEQGMMKDDIDLIIDYPSNIALMLKEGKIDIGLVPVAIIPELQSYHIIGKYCIGSVGQVKSVCLFSEVPLAQIETILLDYQSRTSVKLAQVLMKEHWKINPLLKPGEFNFQSFIAGTTAAVVIGDRALVQRQISRYEYDLGKAWQDLTGMPFVFAAWVTNKELPAGFIEKFNEANQTGFDYLDEIVALNPYPAFDLKKYYTECISYQLTKEKMNGLQTFLNKLTSYKSI